MALQSHLDMVHQKNNDTQFDFDTDGIRMKVEGDWVKAEGTTLGADNGIGVATIMALLASTDIPHPPLEALFTIDEETGMTGAFELKGGLLDAHILLNLDTEEDNELTIGCAGGVDVTAKGTYAERSRSAADARVIACGERLERRPLRHGDPPRARQREQADEPDPAGEREAWPPRRHDRGRQFAQCDPARERRQHWPCLRTTCKRSQRTSRSFGLRSRPSTAPPTRN